MGEGKAFPLNFVTREMVVEEVSCPEGIPLHGDLTGSRGKTIVTTKQVMGRRTAFRMAARRFFR
jgi:hypothetical protein